MDAPRADDGTTLGSVSVDIEKKRLYGDTDEQAGVFAWGVTSGSSHNFKKEKRIASNRLYVSSPTILTVVTTSADGLAGRKVQAY